MKESAGLLIWRQREGRIELLLVHPGGPFWKNKDSGAWTIPKGEFDGGEDPLTAARREFAEETGFTLDGAFVALGSLRQAGGKVVHAWAVEGDCDPGSLRSNTFSLEWPPRSGRRADFPEVDRAAWFTLDAARERILRSQAPFLDRLVVLLRGKGLDDTAHA